MITLAMFHLGGKKMSTTQKKYSAAFKTKVVLDVLGGDKTVG